MWFALQPDLLKRCDGKRIDIFCPVRMENFTAPCSGLRSYTLFLSAGTSYLWQQGSFLWRIGESLKRVIWVFQKALIMQRRVIVDDLFRTSQIKGSISRCDSPLSSFSDDALLKSATVESQSKRPFDSKWHLNVCFRSFGCLDAGQSRNI